MNAGQGSNTIVVSGEIQVNLSEACTSWTSDHEAESIRLETEWRREMAIALDAAATETCTHRRQSAIIAWLVGSWLVGLMLVLAAIAWAS